MWFEIKMLNFKLKICHKSLQKITSTQLPTKKKWDATYMHVNKVI